MDISKVPPVSREHRLELLALAKSSRAKWVMDASDEKYEFKQKREDVFALPIARPIQKVLDFFSDVSEDKEYIDICGLSPDLLVEELDLGNTTEDESESNSFNPMHEFESEDYQNSSYYHKFLLKLKHPLSGDIVKHLQIFVLKCKACVSGKTRAATGKDKFDPKDSNVPVSPTALFSFLDGVYSQMKQNLLWNTESLEDFHGTCEQMEKFLFVKVYDMLMNDGLSEEEVQTVYHSYAKEQKSPSGPLVMVKSTLFSESFVADALLDQQLHARMELLSFMSPEHLDIRCLSIFEYLEHGGVNSWHANLAPAIFHLQQLSKKRCPNDKIECIKAWSDLCTEIIVTAQNKTKKSFSPLGADEFLPLLILCLLRSGVERLHSNRKFLQLYVSPSKQTSEHGYLLSQFISAVHFLEHADSKSLTIAPEEYQRYLEDSIAAAKHRVVVHDVGFHKNESVAVEAPWDAHHEIVLPERDQKRFDRNYPLVSARQLYYM